MHYVSIGFNQKWVQLLMNCVRSIKYRIKDNGKLTDEIISKCGLKQGGLLSPYLFFLCAEGFSSLLHHAEVSNMIQGIQLCHGAPSLTHLLFAEDSLILMGADEENAQHLQQVLDLYEQSGQNINREKSSVMFRKIHRLQPARKL